MDKVKLIRYVNYIIFRLLNGILRRYSLTGPLKDTFWDIFRENMEQIVLDTFINCRQMSLTFGYNGFTFNRSEIINPRVHLAALFRIYRFFVSRPDLSPLKGLLLMCSRNYYYEEIQKL